MTFTNPNALWLLLSLPIFVVIGWPRLPYRRRRDLLSLGIRLLLITSLVLALAGPQIQRDADKLAVVFVLDFSDSVTPDLQRAAVDYVRQAAEAMGEDDQAAVVVFGANALVEIPITDQLELVQIGSAPVRLNTDMAEAMRVALALFPADTAKRMVILTDGRQTVGDAEGVARLAAATQVQIDYVLLGGQAASFEGPDMLISAVDAPTIVNEGERFNLSVTIESTFPNPTGAELRVLSGGEVLERRALEVAPGSTSEIFEVVAPASGFADFQVFLEPVSGDRFHQNNRLSAFTEITGPPSVLLVTTDEQEIASLRSVLEETGLNVSVAGPRDLPVGLAPLSAYDAIVMANVPATELTPDRMEYLQAYVRDLGGGLVMIGGPESYGVGGYFDTPIEETLPVEMRLRDKERVPQLTMLFVIDRSGSMQIASSGGVTNLELAKEAVIRSMSLLTDSDRIGVMSFDTGAYYVVELQTVGDEVNREDMRRRIGALRPGGGTNIRQGILSADQALRDGVSEVKHIILLTDGGSDQAGIAAAVERMNQNYGITTSVVAIGQGQDRFWLREVAEAGQGKFHFAYDVGTIPAIFTAETLLATRSYIFEEEFFAAVSQRHPIISGFDSFPALNGYIATTPKETASVILRGPEDDPILAAWQYGLGRSVAFTSDANDRWAVNWINWSGYSDFWSQAIRWTIVEGNTENIEARVVERGKEAVLMVDVRDTGGDFLNGLALNAAVVDVALDRQVLELRQTAPGRYEAVFTPSEEGAYFITVSGGSTAESDELTPYRVNQTLGWVLSYSSEYRYDDEQLGQDVPTQLMQRISRVTGGGSLLENPSRAFAHNLSQEQAAQPIWQYFALAALLLLPLDVAVRRLIITPSDVQRLREWLAGWFGPALTPAPAADVGRMGRLLDAKGRARSTRVSDENDRAPAMPPTAPRKAEEPISGWSLPSPPPDRRTRRSAAPSATDQPAAAPPKPAPRPASPPSSSNEAAGGSLASRLLKSRQSDQDGDE